MTLSMSPGFYRSAPPAGAEVVVVGSGLSGLAVANDLVVAGVHDVLVLETGPAQCGEPRWKGAQASGPAWRTLSAPHYRPPGPGSAESAHPGVGGRSLYWHGVILRIENYALADGRWPMQSRACLLGDGNVMGLYEETAAQIDAWAASGGGTAAAERGHADTVFVQWLNAATGSAASLVPQAVRTAADGQRQVFTPLERFTRLCAEQPGAMGPRLHPDVFVERVAAAGGRTTGVFATAADGTSLFVEAGTVVLAAGAIENTRLVGQLAADRAMRFDGLNDHLTQGFVARVPVARLLPELHDGAFALLERSARHRCNVFARLHPLAGGQAMLLDVWALGEQLPSGENRVDVERPAQGRDARWSVSVYAGLSEPDRHVVAGEQRLLARAWARLAAQLGLPHRPLCFQDFLSAGRSFHEAKREASLPTSDAALSYAWPLGAGDHEGGTLALGALLDPNGALRAVDGVFVVGPATFPRAGAANPSLTTLALARNTARAICAIRRGV